MVSGVELALTSLLPTTSYLPPELIDLSHSLLAQSHTRASSLKPEEEIGRTYACCHVACERLGKRLALEIGRPAPPVKPRVYEKLKTYLGSVLRTPVTPRSKRIEAKMLDGRDPSVKNTPVKSAPTTTPPFKRAVGGIVMPTNKPAIEYPGFMPQVSRRLCKIFNTPKVHSHIQAAEGWILNKMKQDQEAECSIGEERAAKRRRTDVGTLSEDLYRPRLEHWRLPAFIIVLYLCVAGKRYGFALDGEDYEQRKDKAVDDIHAFCKAHIVELKELPGKHEMQEDVDYFMGEARSSWMKLQWYSNVPITDGPESQLEIQETTDADDDDLTPVKRPSKTPLRRKEKHARREDGEEELGAAGLLPGLGTMFQPALDWLSDERRAEYAQWKKNILHEVALIEQEG